MCWSGEASAAIAIAGLSSAYFLKRKGEPKEIYIPTAYFVLMEGLQALTYIVVNQCGTTTNLVLTYLAIAHISFQPIFINMLAMEFIKPEVKKRIKWFVYSIAGVVAMFCLLRLLPLYDLLGHCQPGTPICSIERTCAYRGQWHIAWDVLLNGVNERWWIYVLGAFALPILYGSWKMTIYHLFVGPFLAALTTTNVNERPAVWCLFSTCIIALLVNTRLRLYMHVKSWFPWKFLTNQDAPKEEVPVV